MPTSKPICPYCQRVSEYVDSAVVYSRSYGMIYLCRSCRAWVGVHKGTDRPLGRLADAELRDAKKAAHAAFDPLWKRKMRTGVAKNKARGAGYRWLAEQLDIPYSQCHIGMFDANTCRRVVDICTPPYGRKD